MAIRDNQKMVVFENKNLVKELIEEEANMTGLNTSNVIENNLLSKMLTDNSDIRYLFKTLYSGETSYNHFMEALFGIIAVDCTDTMRVKSNYQLVVTAKKMAGDQKPFSKEYKDDYCTSYLKSQLDSIAKRCENLVEEAGHTDKFLMELISSNEITENITTVHLIQGVKKYNSDSIQKLANHIRAVIENYNDIDNITFREVYQIIIDAWEYIYQFPFTYKLLLELSKIQKNYDSKFRYELRKAINLASKDWH